MGPPVLGEHTREILQALAALGEAEISALEAENIIQSHAA
jgi:crotonobetainyl-CoA:carnitine CoA-transferase CaiB-like acyl-CoA transferase